MNISNKEYKEVRMTHITKPFMTSTETARYLNISINTLYYYCSKHMLPYYKLHGRRLYFKREDLDQYICSSNNYHGVKELDTHEGESRDE